MNNIENLFKQLIKGEITENLKLPADENIVKELIAKFILYLRELQKWNKAYNLTSIDDEREIVIKHFIDSLLYLYYIPEKPLKIADVGSGAGFPGVPIALVRPCLKVFLIEPSWKKCAFLKNIKRKLQLTDVEIIQAKVEDISDKFDIVLSRALWSIKDFIKNCLHLLKKDGYFLISKSIKLEGELKELPSHFKTELKEFILPNRASSPKALKRYIIKIEYANLRD
ncbi:MAG: 16S rRNA (guanine(527)-N(7))-methyltransferase RsmG [Thermodesulfovibrio sp.]|nr:16S rRNA (guanine(527)-N(7))-methyltransferase RsmG [Thermodesulfovibrio sp.]